MATADITLSQFQTELGAAKTALEGGNFATARLQIALAQTTLSGLFANQSMAGRSYQLNQQAIDSLVKAIELAESASSNRAPLFSRTRITGMGRP